MDHEIIIDTVDTYATEIETYVPATVPATDDNIFMENENIESGIDLQTEIENGKIHVNSNEYKLGVTCKTLEEAKAKLQEFEHAHVIKFVVRQAETRMIPECKNKDAVEGDRDVKMFLGSRSRVRWTGRQDGCAPLPYDGVPFVYGRVYSYQCQHGGSSKKENHTDHSYMGEGIEGRSIKRARSEQRTKKIHCPAAATIKEVFKFPDYVATADVQRRCEMLRISKKLRKDLQDTGKDVRWETSYYVEIDNHHNHPIGQAAGEHMLMDKRLRIRIHELVGVGITDLPIIKRILLDYVRNFLFRGEPAPPETDRRYYPMPKDVRNHVDKARSRLKEGRSACVCGECLWYVSVEDVSVEHAAPSESATATEVLEVIQFAQ